MIAWQDPPPYIQYMEEAEALGRASYMAGVCKSLGIVEVEQADVVELGEDFQRRAILAGVDGPVLSGAVQSGVEREEANVQVMIDFGPEGSESYARRQSQAAEYIGNACAELVINYPEVFSMASDQ